MNKDETVRPKLTAIDVLVAVDLAIRPYSTYIADELSRVHRAHVKAGGSGHPPRASLVLARLRQLAADGMLECVSGPNGYYGYEWRITDAGRKALSAHSQT